MQFASVLLALSMAAFSLAAQSFDLPLGALANSPQLGGLIAAALRNMDQRQLVATLFGTQKMAVKPKEEREGAPEVATRSATPVLEVSPRMATKKQQSEQREQASHKIITDVHEAPGHHEKNNKKQRKMTATTTAAPEESNEDVATRDVSADESDSVADESDNESGAKSMVKRTTNTVSVRQASLAQNRNCATISIPARVMVLFCGCEDPQCPSCSCT